MGLPCPRRLTCTMRPEQSCARTQPCARHSSAELPLHKRSSAWAQQTPGLAQARRHANCISFKRSLSKLHLHIRGSGADRFTGTSLAGSRPMRRQSYFLPPLHAPAPPRKLSIFLTPLQFGSLACARATRKQRAASGFLPVPLKPAKG